MSENVTIEQKAGLGSGNTQIVQQNNYIGMSPSEASKLAMDLFIENFPNLQTHASEIAQKRVDELFGEVLKKLSEYKVTDYNPFASPDVQCALWEAEKNYARTGKKEQLTILSTLIAQRIQKDDNNYFVSTLNRAIEIVSLFSSRQLDYLSVLFICKRVKLGCVCNIETLQKELNYIDSIFSPCSYNATSLLVSMGCLTIGLGRSTKILSEIYDLKEEDVKAICPKNLLNLAADYSVSDVGTIIAIINAEAKSRYRFDSSVWIHD